MNIFAAKVERQTVDGVMAAFSKTITDLQAVQEQEQAEAQRQYEVAAIASAAKDAAEAEAARAGQIIGKLQKLLV